MINKEPERYDIEALLPWHAAGTLSRRDADRVEQALAGDRELARRYDLVREELAETSMSMVRVHARKRECRTFRPTRKSASRAHGCCRSYTSSTRRVRHCWSAD